MYGTMHNRTRSCDMPYFYFDLVIGGESLHQGGMILENLAAAAERADRLAHEIALVRPELLSRSCAIRVTNDDGTEVYHTMLGATPRGRVRSDRLVYSARQQHTAMPDADG